MQGFVLQLFAGINDVDLLKRQRRAALRRFNQQSKAADVQAARAGRQGAVGAKGKTSGEIK